MFLFVKKKQNKIGRRTKDPETESVSEMAAPTVAIIIYRDHQDLVDIVDLQDQSALAVKKVNLDATD